MRRDAVYVLVFSRTPRPGQVMTRLACRVGVIAAARLYRSLVLRTLDTVVAGGLPACLYRHGKGRSGDWLHTQARQRGMPIYNQYGRDLGARMYHAIRHRLAAGAKAAIVTGCDCPALTPALLTAAAHALKQGAELVLGPVLDGGYYLIGVCKSQVRLFDAVPWGTDKVCRHYAESRRVSRIARPPAACSGRSGPSCGPGPVSRFTGRLAPG